MAFVGKTFWTTVAFAGIGVAMLSIPPAGAAEDHIMVIPQDIAWKAAPPSLPPGAQLAILEGDLTKAEPLTWRVKFPTNYQIAAHRHPGIEHVTVLSGTFNLGFGEQLDRAKTTALPAGAFLAMQPATNHFAWTGEETVIQVHTMGPWGITYVNPKDDPRTKTN